ncbi:hypothetical protein PEX1_019150 [Penicillium expansum]|nr:hypothetical protein PEXP_039390 [Penicillium expansum]KGO61064.1 hypothetical protein PEX1_019150 [Penicillium expansum]
MRRDKPFLLLTILTAALHDNMPLQRTLEKQIKKVISDCMIFDGSVSFEIFQGLLVHLAWISQILQKGSFLPYLPYFESICKVLAADAEYPSDRYLLYIVQLQQLSEKITLVSSQHVPEIQNTSVSLQHYYREFKPQLDLFRANLPFLLTESQILFMQFYTVELYLCQITLFDHKPGAQPPPHELSFQIEVLRMGLAAAKTLLHFYISLPLGYDAKFHNVGWVQLAFAVTLACKLVVAASDPSIHPHTVDLCRALDISSTMRQSIIRIQALITSDMDDSGDRDIFFHYEKRLKRVQWWFESRTISGPNNAHSHDGVQLAGAIVSSTGDARHYVDALQPTSNDLDNNFQWLDFFPDTAIDEMYIDWMAQPTTSFDQQRLG